MNIIWLIALILSRCPGSTEVTGVHLITGTWVITTAGADVAIRPKFARVFVNGVEVPNTLTNAWAEPIPPQPQNP